MVISEREKIILQFDDLVLHVLNCDKPFGKCTVLACPILKRVMGFLNPSSTRKRVKLQSGDFSVLKRARIDIPAPDSTAAPVNASQRNSIRGCPNSRNPSRTVNEYVQLIQQATGGSGTLASEHNHYTKPSIANQLSLSNNASSLSGSGYSSNGSTNLKQHKRPASKINLIPPKGSFVATPVQYYLEKDENFPHLLECLTNNQLDTYLTNLRTRNLQQNYSSLVQLLIQHRDNHNIFNDPVDPSRVNCPNYFDVVARPMDLGTVRDKLSNGSYPTARELVADIRLVFQNAKRFNPPEHFVSVCANNMLKVLDTEIERLKSRLEQVNRNLQTHNCNACRGIPCKLCGDKCLKYSPLVLVCDGECKERILRNNTYFMLRGKKGKYCQKCYSKMINGMDKNSRKTLFIRKKNDGTFPESWIQCSRCRERMHCVCSLVHPRQSNCEFVCPDCLRQDNTRQTKTLRSARDLPRTPLSDFLQDRIMNCVRKEMSSRPQKNQLTEETIRDVQDSLFIRCVSNIEGTSPVKSSLAPLYSSTYASEVSIPFRSRCLAFFQHRNGFDVILFVLYVREYGGPDCCAPNQRCVYISYLDSVHFLTPRYLRSSLYHEIVISYLEYAKQHGYCRAHIWACPPSRGDDYIFSHHPRDQRTPNANHLITWYRHMLQKGVDAGVISFVSCQLDMLLLTNAVHSPNAKQMQRIVRSFTLKGSSAEEELPEVSIERPPSVCSVSSPCSSDYSENEGDVDNDAESLDSMETNESCRDINSMHWPVDPSLNEPIANAVPNGSLSSLESILMLLIPYFDGDYLPYIGNDLLKEIYNESLKREAKAAQNKLQHSSSISSSPRSKSEKRDRLLQDCIRQLPSEFLRKFAKAMLENPSRFLVVYLRPYCCYCGEVIDSSGRKCDECFDTKVPFYLCERCFNDNQLSHGHVLSPLHEPPLPPLSNQDPIISHVFFDKRHEFLRLCQGNFLQFDTLRHAMLSTSVLVQFLFSKVADPFLDCCDTCETVLYKEFYACSHNDDYRLCKDCLNRDGGLHACQHSHFVR